MTKKFHKAREVFKIKNQLYKVAPFASDVDVRIKRLSTGRYKSQVLLNIPSRKRIVSAKVDDTIPESLEKAYKAAIKQVNKTVKKSFHRKSIRHLELEKAA